MRLTQPSMEFTTSPISVSIGFEEQSNSKLTKDLGIWIFYLLTINSLDIMLEAHAPISKKSFNEVKSLEES